MQRFEIGLYNKTVRDLLGEGERHKHLDDSWADVHYVDVTAASEDEARSKIARRYPERDGYVISSVVADRY